MKQIQLPTLSETQIKWLEAICDKYIKFYENNPDKVDDGLEHAITIREAIGYGTIVKDNDKPKKSSTQISYNYCKKHPKYAAVRFPSNGCESCLSVYKELHPLDFDKKFADWNRKQKAANASGK